MSVPSGTGWSVAATVAAGENVQVPLAPGYWEFVTCYDGADCGAPSVNSEAVGCDGNQWLDHEPWIQPTAATCYVRQLVPAGEQAPRITVEDAVQVTGLVWAAFAAVFALKFLARAARP